MSISPVRGRIKLMSPFVVALQYSLQAANVSVVVPEFTTDSNGVKSGTIIPDFGISGGSPSLFPITVNIPLDSITDINLRIQTEGGLNSDLSAYLLFGDDVSDPFAVLFSQIRGSTSGMNVWLDDQAPTDVESTGGVGSLTGTFRPAGPENLGSFNGLNPNSKTWFLAIADNSNGLESNLLEWELQFTGSSSKVPDSPLGITLALTLGACVHFHRRLNSNAPRTNSKRAR